MNSFRSYLFISLSVLFFLGCASEEQKEEAKLFELLPSTQTGVNFQNTLTSSLESNILEYLYFYNGGGVATGDINGDGLVDLYFTGNQVPNRLYLNRGNFQFEDITESAGVSGDGGWSTGVTMGDVNGDGLLDIYVCQVGDYGKIQGQNKLYLNLGEGRFQEVGKEFGVDFKGFSTHAAFLDYDRDGDLDLYLLNHNVKSPEVFAQAGNREKIDPSGDKLFKNLLMEGGKGFEDVTLASGIYSSILGFGLGVAVEDFNGDGWLDLYVSNDFTENDYLYLNQQDGTFRESLQELISSTSRYSMGNDAADLNGDGWPDIFTTDMLPEDPEVWMKSVGEDKAEVYQIKSNFDYGDQYVRNHLQLNAEGNGFSEIAQFADVHASDWSWSPLLFDMDNDGLLDIHVSNGIAKRPNDLDFIQYSQDADARTPMEELREKQISLLPKLEIPNFAWINQGDLRFENKAKQLGLDHKGYSNGSAYADLDNDGDLDLVINNIDQEAFIYQNHSEKSGNHHLRVALRGQKNNSFGIGAKVKLFASGQTWTQRLSTSRGFQSGPSTTLVFGLGNTATIDSIQVSWPEGDLEVYPGISSDTLILLEKGMGIMKEFNVSMAVSEKPEPAFPWKHDEKSEVDFIKREYLALKTYSMEGPAVAVGDVNGDGLDDLYLGGAKDQAGVILIQQPSGQFVEVENPIFRQLAKAEDTVAEFADFNGDGLLDLYVGSGGNEYPTGNLFAFDRLFFGNGQGKFQFAMNSLPPLGENTSAIVPFDLDQDGDLDLFVGASVVTGDYGASPKSALLINNGNGQFSDASDAMLPEGGRLGMINTAAFVDLLGDGSSKLVISGDWNSIRVLEFKGGKLVERSIPGLEYSSGWIQTLQFADVNQDGKMDILVGNLGENTKLKASETKPLWLYHHDFDENGQADPIVFHYMGDKLVPFATRDDLIRQIPGLKRKHSSYAAYSQITRPEDLFSEKELEGVYPKPVYQLKSGMYVQNTSGGFEWTPFPAPLQYGPIQSLVLDEEGILYVSGNSMDFRVDLGKSIALKSSAWKWSNGMWRQLENLPPTSDPVVWMGWVGSKATRKLLQVSNNGFPVWLK
ncbi:VCBS repeat-containing protein [Algoriphagus sanaruensis]|uniref:VCBS repeat-containing protein n=1 Tax=Algoriphagus sanaruensis TaxID=1727163 RepID=UPI0009EF3E55|nr:VCBS repeat-containing protein [Algoriphagus sanaruensis]